MGGGSDFQSRHIILLKMSTFQQRILCHPKKWLSMDHTQGKKAINGNYPWGSQDVGLTRQRL